MGGRPLSLQHLQRARKEGSKGQRRPEDAERRLGEGFKGKGCEAARRSVIGAGIGQNASWKSGALCGGAKWESFMPKDGGGGGKESEVSVMFCFY